MRKHYFFHILDRDFVGDEALSCFRHHVTSKGQTQVQTLWNSSTSELPVCEASSLLLLIFVAHSFLTSIGWPCL